MNKKKIVILGSTGMLGHILYNYLKEKEKYEIFCYNRDQFDFSKEWQIENLCYFLEHKDIDYIINCVGILIKGSEENPEAAKKVNSDLPKKLSHFFRYDKTKIIHISTDCVFDGKRGAYSEKDIPNETNTYGISKTQGEINNEKDLTIRTSIIGPEIKKTGVGLFHWFVNQKNKKVNGYVNHLWNGITTLEISEIIEIILNGYTITGLINLFSPLIVSKYELLIYIQKYFGLKNTIEEFKAPIFVDKTLISERKDHLNNMISTYENQFKKLKKWIKNHPEIYSNIYPEFF